MRKKILVVGAKGNMGSRYCFYLRYLGCEVIEVDLNSGLYPMKCDGIVIATPTANHFADIINCADYQKPILCEKAISKNLVEVEKLCDSIINLRMINQYDYFNRLAGTGTTYYNYFRHGSDGIAFDCINILGIAGADVHIDESSPIWSCAINGRRIDLGDMDSAYLWNLQDWLLRENDNKDYIRYAHRKVNLWISG